MGHNGASTNDTSSVDTARLVAVIMAGGRGERFWPKSRRAVPKQFLPLLGGRTMLQLTVDRVLPVIPLSHVYVVTGRQYANLVTKQLPDLPWHNLILEPEGRDTAAAIGLAALHVVRDHPDAVMAVLPADHIIGREAEFHQLLRAAAKTAEHTGGFATFGIKPSYPETGYGYIETGDQVAESEGRQFFRVKRFTEKPDVHTAETFVASGRYFWNSGMFVWRAQAVLDGIRNYLPRLALALDTINRAMDGPDSVEITNREFADLPKVSIDYGVMEKANEVYVFPADLAWDDVGSWLALARLSGTDAEGNFTRGPLVSIDSHGLIIDSPGKLVAVVGLENVVIVDTPDALLVCHKDHLGDLKRVTARLQEQGRDEYL